MSGNEIRFQQLEKRLHDAGIPTDKAGFFDHPAFVAIEKRDPNFLDEYARFVHWRRFDAPYLQRAEQIINVVVDELHRGLVLEGRLGGCIDTSMTMGRILDLYGVWNYVVRGSLRITFPATSGHAPFCFWPVDEDDGSGREYGHKWLVAPPFSVIDVTLKLQDYERSFRELLPEKVLAKDPRTTKGDPEDILCPSAIYLAGQQGLSPSQALARFVPKYVQSFAADFPAYLVRGPDELELKYVPVGIGGSDSPLKNIRSFMVTGRTAFEFYEQEIKAKLAAAGFEETLSDSEFQGMVSSSPGAAPPLPPKRRSFVMERASPRDRAEREKSRGRRTNARGNETG
jgi:hypothetical protein